MRFCLGDGQQVDARRIRQDETGTAFIQAVAVGANRQRQFDTDMAFVFGQRYVLQDDTPVHQMVNAVRPRRIIGFRIDIRCNRTGVSSNTRTVKSPFAGISRGPHAVSNNAPASEKSKTIFFIICV